MKLAHPQEYGAYASSYEVDDQEIVEDAAGDGNVVDQTVEQTAEIEPPPTLQPESDQIGAPGTSAVPGHLVVGVSMIRRSNR